MNKLKDHNLGFFLTEGVSLRDWEKAGMFSREIEPYNKLADYFNKIYIFTQGNKSELEYQKYFKPNIEIVYNKSKFKNGLYYFLLPFLHRKIIKKCSILKTNQMLGSQALILTKIFVNKKTKIVIRTGHPIAWVRKMKKQRKEYLWALILEFFAYKICDIAMVTTQQMKDIAIKKYKVKKEKVFLIANYINTKIFAPNQNTKKYNNNNKIVFVGRPIPQKNLYNLIKALKNIDDVELDLYGPKTDIVGLEKLAKELNVKINFPEYNIPNEKIPEILNKYNIFILPSRWESKAKTLLEAMSCGLACIGTNVEGTKEVIIDGENGLLSDTTPESLRKNIIKLINDKNLQEKLGKNARQFILNNYSLDKEILKEIEIYENLL
jgi:glycosyltransferase involved in cell wall biosynthesis